MNTRDASGPDRNDRSGHESTAVMASLALYLDDVEPMPTGLLETAVAAYTWRNVDAELLDLLVDSVEADLELVRAESAVRVIAFGSPDRGVHFECHRVEAHYRLEGIVQPPAPVIIVAERPGETMTVRTDEAGSFDLGPIAPGSVRLVIREIDGGVVMLTPWFVLDR